MADLEKTIKILFEGEAGSLTQSIRGVSGGIDSLADKVGTVAKPIADFTDKLLTADAAMIGLSASILALSINEAAKFDGAFREINTLMDATGESVRIFRTDIVNYAGDSTQSFEQINAAVYSAISAGVSYEDSLKALSSAEKLAVAGKADLESTLVALASTVNAYGGSMDEAARYSDVFFTTVKLGQTTIPELSAALAQVTSVAATLNVPIETLGASIATLTAGGMQTSQAVTGLKAAFSNLIKPSAEASELAALLGIKFDATAIKTKGFEGVLADVQKATGGNVEQMGKLFGSTEALTAVLALTGSQAGKFKESLEAMRNSAGATDVAYSKMADSISLVNQNLANNLRAALIQIGDRLLDDYAGVARSMADVFKGLRVGVDAGAFEPVFQMIERFAGELQDKLQIVAKNLPDALAQLDFSGLVQSFGALGTAVSEAFGKIFPKIDLTTVEGLKDALQGVVNIFERLNMFTVGVIESFGWVFEALGKAAQGMTDVDRETAKTAGTFGGIAKQVLFVTENIGVLTGSLNFLGGVISVFAATKIPAAVAGIAGLGVKIAGAAVSAASLAGSLGPVGIAGAVGAVIGTIANQSEYVQKAGQTWAKWADELFDWTGAAKEAEARGGEAVVWIDGIAFSLEEARKKWRDMKVETVAASEETDTYAATVKELLALDPTLEFYIDGLDEQTIRDAIDTLNAQAKGYEVSSPVKLRLDELAADKAERDAMGRLEQIGARADGTPIMVQVEPRPGDIEEVQEKIDKLSEDKKILIELEKAKIAAQASTVEAALKFKAEIDIANFESNAERVMALTEGIASAFGSTGDVLGSVFGAFDDISGPYADKMMNLAKRQIETETDIRKEQHEMQKEILKLEGDRLRIQNERLASGAMPEIKIDSTGLEPALEMIMWEIIEKVQIRASESLAEFLLGVA